MIDSILFYVTAGGFTVKLLVVGFFVMCLICVERIYVLYVVFPVNSESLVGKVNHLISKKNYIQALQVCDQHIANPVAKLLRQGLLAAEGGREALKSSLGGALTEVASTVESRVPFLALIASSATLLGLLGTISGLIKTFSGMAAMDPAQKAVMLGQGIAEAMYSTGAGLVVGLIAMAIHTVLKQRALNLKNECRKASYDLLKNIEKAEKNLRHG